MNGVIIIDKPAGMTSQAVVTRVKRLFGEKKAGHGGTLDPMATGVLPVMVGNSVGASQYIASEDKTYLAEIKFGLETDTEDTTGNTLKEYPLTSPTMDEFADACRHFEGEIMQTPPMYSALKVGGKKLCDLARKGIEIDRAPRVISIYGIEPSIVSGRYFIKVHCGKGTYIRTLCADIGRFLGTGAVMADLRRMSAGMFDIERSFTLDALEEMSLSEREACLIKNEALFEKFTRVTLSPENKKVFSNGGLIDARSLPLGKNESEIYSVYGEDGFFALGECIEREGNIWFKVKKFFI